MSGELGRTRLYTIRELRRRAAAAVLALLGAAVTIWVAVAAVSWVDGDGWQWPSLGMRPLLSTNGKLGAAGDGPQFPVTLALPPVSPVWTAVVAAAMWAVWLRLIVIPFFGLSRGHARHRGLARSAEVRRALGHRRVRKAGRYTLPGTTWWQRFLLPTSDFGFALGFATQDGKRGVRLWADWEQRIRIIARTGWGKTYRLLIPMIRDLPGPALVSSIEPEIFNHTVTARTHRRRRLRWRVVDRLARSWLPRGEYPVAVVDFSAPEHRFAAGYPRVRWNLIGGCEHFATAMRRATTLVSAMASGIRKGGVRDKFFLDSATAVLAAWLHAAALADKEIDDLVAWLRKPKDPTPRRILDDDPRAENAAELSLSKHLDDRAATTSSGVERYLMIAMSCLASNEGRRLCGRRFDENHQLIDQFDMAALIEASGTLYILTEEGRTDFIKPLLSLFTAEMFRAATSVALRSPSRRLPLPFIAVLDEPRHAVPVPDLPHVANALRKYNIGYVLAAQSAAQEDELFGEEAAALRAAAGVSLIGGIDIASAHEVSQRAGDTPVVIGSRGQGRRGDQIQIQPVFTVGDQQALRDGESTVLARGLTPFVAVTPDPRSRRRWRAVAAEARRVTTAVALAGAAEQAELHAVSTGAPLRRKDISDGR